MDTRSKKDTAREEREERNNDGYGVERVEGGKGRRKGRGDKAGNKAESRQRGPSFNSVCIANRWSIRVSTTNDTVDRAILLHRVSGKSGENCGNGFE